MWLAEFLPVSDHLSEGMNYVETHMSRKEIAMGTTKELTLHYGQQQKECMQAIP